MLGASSDARLHVLNLTQSPAGLPTWGLWGSSASATSAAELSDQPHGEVLRSFDVVAIQVHAIAIQVVGVHRSLDIRVQRTLLSRRVLTHLASTANRNFVVPECKANLIAAQRQTTLKKFGMPKFKKARGFTS